MKSLRALPVFILLFAACGGDDGAGPNGIATVTVSAPVTSITVGATTQLNATARDGSGSVVTSGTISWSTSSANVASVSNTGLVTALAAGQSNITASLGGKSGSLTVTVSNPVGAQTVTMPGFSFAPFTTNITVGGTVIFEFPAEPHNVIFNRTSNGAPTDIQVTSNRSVARTFPTAGTFPYDCTLHPGMSGQVIVR